MKNDYEDINLKKGYDMLYSKESASEIISRLDTIAERVQAKGLLKEAEDIDIIANTLEKMAGNIPAGSDRPAPVFDDKDPDVNDGKDHFPIPDKKHAQNALQRVNQYDEAPEWFDGSLKKVKKEVVDAVKAKFPSIDVDEEKY